MANTRAEIGEKLRKARVRIELTQAAVASKAEIHLNYYARIERGEENPSLEVFEKIIKALKIKSSDILPF